MSVDSVVADSHYADLPLATRLQSMRQRMVQTSEAFIDEIDKRDAKLHDQHRALRELFSNAEQAVVAESHRRSEIDRLLENTLESRMLDMSRLLESAVDSQCAQLEDAIAVISGKLEHVFHDIQQDRRGHGETIAAFHKQAVTASAELMREVEKEKSIRVDFETAFSGRCTKELSYISEQVGIQTQLRGKSDETLKDDLGRIGRLLEKESYQQSCGALLRDIEEAKRLSRERSAEREASQQALTDAMGQLVQQVNESFAKLNMYRGTHVLGNAKPKKGNPR